MARLDELAEGLAGVLAASPTPEPLPVDMWNETPAAATVLVRAIIDACERRAASLARIAICPVLGADLLRQHGGTGYQGVAIAADEDLADRFAIYRFPDSNERHGTALNE